MMSLSNPLRNFKRTDLSLVATLPFSAQPDYLHTAYRCTSTVVYTLASSSSLTAWPGHPFPLKLNQTVCSL